MMAHRATWIALAMMWPVGLVLVVANMEVAAITLPVFVVLDVAYVTGTLWLLNRVRNGGADPETATIATVLVLAGVGLFAIVGFTGIPSAAEPDLMMLNTAALLGAAVALLFPVISLLWIYRSSPQLTSVLVFVALFVIGSALYVVNLLARMAVVLSGAAQQQAAAEGTAWVAYEYLRGLNQPPNFMSYLLVWMDLLQVAYVVSAFLAIAAVSRLLSGQLISGGFGRGLRLAGISLATVIVAGVLCAVVLPREFDAVPAWAVFVATIPFMTTLLPFVLGLALLRGFARQLTVHPLDDSPTMRGRRPTSPRRSYPEGITR